MATKAWIRQLLFSDGSRVDFDSNDIVVVVGPNNSGKSTLLREMLNISSDLHWVGNANVIKGLAFGKEGTEEDFLKVVAAQSHTVTTRSTQTTYSGYRGNFDSGTVAIQWREMSSLGLQGNLPFIMKLISAEERLGFATSIESYDLLESYPQHPIHFLYKSEDVELKFSDAFRRAFNLDLVVNKAAGRSIHLHIGDRPAFGPGEHSHSEKFLEKLKALPRIQQQGDGMKSFIGLLLQTLFDHEYINLIDEPEVFLHPPQARLLGKMIATDVPTEKQLFISTHSEDVLKGLLDSKNKRVKVLRINRKGSVNEIVELTKSEIETTWSDSLLRHSNVLSGLFHTRVVLCEGDADCRFYSAVLDALVDEDHVREKDKKEFKSLVDPLFIHCGGKQRMPVVIKALRKLNVPISVIPDFDVLNEIEPLKSIWAALGGQWTDIEKDFKIIKAAVDGMKTELVANEVKDKISKVLEAVKDHAFPADKATEIKEILKRSSPWALAKENGKTFLPAGDATQAFDRLNQRLNYQGLYIVDVGILESFVKSVGNHGPKWVNEVLQKDVRTESIFDTAKQFVKKVFK